MKKLLLLLSILLSLSAYSKEIYEKTARKAAKNFIARNGGDSSGCVLLKKDESFYYYDFNHGCVVVRKYDQIKPIARYSTTQQYSECRESLAMMKVAAEKVQASKFLNLPPTNELNRLLSDKPPMVRATKTVAPLVQYILNQEENFWDSMGICKGHNLHIEAGCGPVVQTTLSLYWKWPKSGVGSFSYTDPEGGLRSCDFSKSRYDYTGIPYRFTSPHPVVCKLIREYGVADQAQLGCIYLGGTGVYGIGTNYRCDQYALINNFQFKSTMKGIYQDKTNNAFDSLIRIELDNGRPVQLFIYTADGAGHTVVVDGYDGNGMFHCLMGWGSAGDSWYSLAGFSVAGYIFNTGFSALIGIEPSGSVPVPTICPVAVLNLPTAITTSSATVSWTGTDSSYLLQYKPNNAAFYISVPLTGNTYNITGLPNNTLINWQVTGYCKGGSVSGVASSSFTTQALPCIAATLLTVSNIASTSATLSFTADASNTSTRVAYSPWSGGTIIFLPATSPFTVTGLLPSTKYSWYINSWCGTTQKNSGSNSFTTTSGSTPPPICVQPTSVSVTSAPTSLAFSWQGSATDSFQLAINGAVINIKGLSYTVNGLQPSTAYPYSLKHLCGSMLSAAVTGSANTSAQPCPNPVTTSASVSTMLTWQNTGAKSYSVTYIVNGASQTTSTVNTSLMVPGSVSSWSVASICN